MENPNQEVVETAVSEGDAVVSESQTEDGLGEFTEGGDATQTSAETSTVKAEEKPKQEWDIERQRADQAEANYRKLQREKADIEQKAQEAEKRIAEMESKINEFAKANDVNLDELESEFIDPTVYKVIKNLQSKLSNLENIAETYRKTETDRQAKEREQQLEVAKEKAKNEIIGDIESEFGSQFRNEALKRADEICNKRGYAPQDRYEAAKILRQCYKEISSQKTTTPKKAIPSDSGKTTVSASPKEDVKPGTLREVMSQLRAKAGLT